jgi:ribosomal protein S18 acetylase RimI-like enzyme
VITGVGIREARINDVPAIIALLKDVVLEGRWVRTQWPFDADARAGDLQNAMEKDRVLCWVAEQSGAVIGQLALFPSGSTAQLGMFIAKSARRMGVGRVLMRVAEEEARRRGFDALELEVYAHNDAAIALYRSAGFEEFGNRRPERRNTGELFEVVNMRKPLR